MPLLAACLLAACQKEEAKPVDEVRPVYSVVVGRSDNPVGAVYSGEIAARYESKLGFRNSGKVAARLVEVGSPVKRGQLLMRLDPAQEALQVIAAMADVDLARSRVAQSRIDLERSIQLQERKFASQAEVDQQRLAVRQAESQLRSAQAQQQVSVNQRGYTTLSADRDGVVTAITAETGQVVAAGQSVVTVAGDGEREVVVSVPESRVDELRQARDLKVSVWAHPGRTWEGSLRELAPGTDSVTRTYSARIAIRHPDLALLRLGMTASVLVPDIGGASAIRVPLTAVVDEQGQRLVWVVDTKTAQVAPRNVKLGSAQNDSVIVVDGLADGETVVTAGVHMLRAGQRVKLVAAATPAASATEVSK